MSATSTIAAAHPSVYSRPWRWSQHWDELLFAHWKVPEEVLRPLVPARLDLDVLDGAAWVTAVAFRLAGVRPRRLPPVGLISNFPELNLRTYVLYRGEPAIYFLSLHAGKRLVVRLARWVTPLPYQYARIDYVQHGARRRFTCVPPASPPGQLVFCTGFTATGQPNAALPDSSEAWLLERYALYGEDAKDNLFRTGVNHQPWEVQSVVVQDMVNSMGEPFGLDLTRRPDLVHFSPGVQARVWPFEVVD